MVQVPGGGGAGDQTKDVLAWSLFSHPGGGRPGHHCTGSKITSLCLNLTFQTWPDLTWLQTLGGETRTINLSRQSKCSSVQFSWETIIGADTRLQMNVNRFCPRLQTWDMQAKKFKKFEQWPLMNEGETNRWQLVGQVLACDQEMWVASNPIEVAPCPDQIYREVKKYSVALIRSCRALLDWIAFHLCLLRTFH